MSDITIKMELTFHQTGGDQLAPSDGVSVADHIIDAFAAEYGKNNGARKPLRVTVTDNHDHEATYELGLVD